MTTSTNFELSDDKSLNGYSLFPMSCSVGWGSGGSGGSSHTRVCVGLESLLHVQPQLGLMYHSIVFNEKTSNLTDYVAFVALLLIIRILIIGVSFINIYVCVRTAKGLAI